MIFLGSALFVAGIVAVRFAHAGQYSAPDKDAVAVAWLLSGLVVGAAGGVMVAISLLSAS